MSSGHDFLKTIGNHGVYSGWFLHDNWHSGVQIVPVLASSALHIVRGNQLRDIVLVHGRVGDICGHSSVLLLYRIGYPRRLGEVLSSWTYGVHLAVQMITNAYMDLQWETF